MRSKIIVTVLAGTGLTLVLSGCGSFYGDGIDLTDAIADAFSFHAPFQATISHPGVAESKVRAALFRADHQITPSGGEQGADAADVELDVSYLDGRVSLWSWSSVSSVELEPLQVADDNTGDVTFILPDLTEDTDLALVVWSDNDGDGRLDLSAQPGASEAARTLFKNDGEGTPHYLTYYRYDAEEDVYTATAVSPDVVNYILGEGDLTGWLVTLPGEIE